MEEGAWKAGRIFCAARPKERAQLMVVPHSPQGVSLPEAAERKAQGGNGEERDRERERVLMMLFELPDPACVLSYKAPPHLGLPDETQLGQLTLNFRYTMTVFFSFCTSVPCTIFET